MHRVYACLHFFAEPCTSMHHRPDVITCPKLDLHAGLQAYLHHVVCQQQLEKASMVSVTVHLHSTSAYMCAGLQQVSVLTCRRRELEQQVQHLAGGVAVIKETLYGPTHSPPPPHSPSRSRSPSPTRVVGDSGALLASHGTGQSPYMIPPSDCISPPGCSF